MKDDKEKLIAWANSIAGFIGPKLESQEAHQIIVEAEAKISMIMDSVIEQAEAM